MEYLYNKVLKTSFMNKDDDKHIFYFQQFSLYDAVNLRPYKNLVDGNIYEYYSRHYEIKPKATVCYSL